MSRVRPARDRSALYSKHSRVNSASRPYRRRLRFEPLEDRRLLSITVNTLVDELDGSITDGDISLRDAIRLAPLGGTIDFAPALTSSGPATISLAHGELAIMLPLTINGPGAELLTINAGQVSRVLNIDDGSNTLLDVEISGLTLTHGYASGPGGAIFTRENLTVARSIITGNVSLSTAPFTGGGGIYSSAHYTSPTPNTLTVLDSVISNNNVPTEGGGIRKRFGSLVVERTTISGNYAPGPGGGISAADGNVDVQIRDSTISGNSGSRGGGIFNYQGFLAITRTTISNNSAFQGGGIFGDASLDNSIVAGNGNDFQVGTFVIAARFTLIGNSGFAMITDNGGNLIGTSASPIDPLLGPLADNGGPTPTHALLAGSPALNRGDPAAMAGVGGVPAFDQRGDPFARVRGGRIDMGSFELSVPMLVVDTLADENDGDYAAGDLSLREAIAFANGSVNPETITFSPSLTNGGPATITLTQGDLQIRNDMTINGPGASLLTIDASGNDPTPAVNNGDGSRVFNIFQAAGTVSISGLTLTGGDAGGSGGAVSNSANLTISAVTISGNSAGKTSTGFHGGGIFHSSGNLTINASTISGNSTTFGRGGGVYGLFGSMTINESTISGNSAALTGIGGGIYCGSMTTTINSSTITGNSANMGGGIVQYGVGHLMTITNSTISGNLARLNGGGAVALFSNLTVRHSTITANRSDADNNGTGSGGGVMISPSFSNVSVNHTIVSGNFRGTSTPDNVVGAVAAQSSLIGHATPMLGPLTNNGGPTMTHALLPASPAIDAGDPDVVAGVGGIPAFDQRGAPLTRVYGGRIDIGAFELQPSGPVLAGDYNLNGVVDSADFVVWRNALGTMGVPAYSGADGDGDTTIDQDDYGVWRAHFGQTLPAPGTGSGAGETLDIETQELRADAQAVRVIAADDIGESVVQVTTGTNSASVDTDAVAPKEALFTALETRFLGHDSTSRSRGRSHRFQVAESGGDDLSLLLAIDRVGRSLWHDSSEEEFSGNGEYRADDDDSESEIDDPLAVALAAWREAQSTNILPD